MIGIKTVKVPYLNLKQIYTCYDIWTKKYTVEFQWIEHLWNHENMFEIGVVRGYEC